MEPRRQAAAVLAGIVLAVSLTVAVRYEPYTFIRRDASFYATIARGLVTHFSLDQRKVQPQSWYSGEHPGYANLDMYWSDVSVGRNGTWYPKHSFLVSVAAAPFYALLGVPGFLVFNVLCVIAMLFAAYLLAARYAPGAPGALAVAFIAASPTLVDHTYLLSADVFNAMLIALGALALYEARPATAGALLGLALWSRPITVLLVVPLAAAGLVGRADRRQLVRFVVAAAVPLAAAAAANTIMYGAPWVNSYDRTLVVENRVPGVASHRSLWTNTLETGFRLMFEDREAGLVDNALPALIALAGLVPLVRRDWKLAAALAVGFVGFVLGYVRYRYFNARFFFAWQVLLVIPLAVLLDAVGGLFGAGAAAARTGWSRAAASVRRLPRAAVWGAPAALVVAAVLVSAVRGRHYVLSDHIAEAQVFRNDFPCDYFNMTHLAWECSRLDHGGEEYTGLALQTKRCRFDGAHTRAILIGPAGDGGTRRLVFSPPRRGRLGLDYGVEAGSPAPELCLDVVYAGRPAQHLCAQGPGRLQHATFEPPSPAEPSRLEITVVGHAPRSLCVDGAVDP
jgi:hypothetical protein